MTSRDDKIQTLFNNLKYAFPSGTDNFAILKIAVNPNNEILRSIYQQKADLHNAKLLSGSFPDSGFDLFVPETVEISKDIDSKFIDFQIKTEMFYCNTLNGNTRNCAFVVYPRSSMSKTPLMLANHTGIIDSGYRGSIIGAFRWLYSKFSTENIYRIEQNTRLVQICHPILCPIYVVMVDESELSNTERGSGGFGSTGVGL
jgi:dUTP pyrophosphatase